MKSTFMIGLAAVLTILIINPGEAASAKPLRQTIARDEALQQSISVQVAPGRMTSIDFDRTNETIVYVGLGDASQTVFSLDAPLESQQTKSVFLKSIQPLKFPGATTASKTNLLIKTVDQTGTKRTYNFNVVPTKVQTIPNLSIASAIAGRQTLTNSMRRVTLRDIELGLNKAIQRRYTSATDPIAVKTRHLLTLAQLQNATIADLARQLRINLAVLETLGKIGQQSI